MKSVQDNKDIKLSDKQKEVIRLMREGWKLHFRAIGFHFYMSKRNETIKQFGYTPFVDTVQILVDKNLIEAIGKNAGIKCYYTLTEFSKTIQL